MSDELPNELGYTAQHEWVRDDGDTVTVGITDYAQDQLGDVVYVDLPGSGAEVEREQPFGEVESTKSVSDLYAPVSGVVVARNDELADRPELVNTDPYGAGWLVELQPSDRQQLDELLSAESYQATIAD